MKISIITVTFNSEKTINDTIQSVLMQSYSNIKYIIIDGKSNDSTLGIVKEYIPLFSGRLKYISEKDSGIYDAMNKGIKLASGDIIGIINSDDFYKSNNVIASVANAFNDNSIEVVFGNIQFVNPNNKTRIVRKYSGKGFRPWMFRWGIMPPHPSFFTRKSCYEKYGMYNSTFNISGDYDLMVRFLLVKKLKYKYMDLDMVIMRLGGASTKSIRSLLINNNYNVIRACRENGVYTNIFMVSLRYIKKISELIFKV